MKKTELLIKSREAMMSAVQLYNNPQITFKSETFITLAIIAWTYLLHAFYANEGIDYRYFHNKGKKKVYDKTKHGAYKHWELERCLDCQDSPIDSITASNLKFLIGIRHEIEQKDRCIYQCKTSSVFDQLQFLHQKIVWKCIWS